MARSNLIPISIPMLAGLATGALLVCGSLTYVAFLGFRINGWNHWTNYATSLWQSGNQDELIAGIGQALPDEMLCGGKWVLSQPGFIGIDQLQRQGNLAEAARVCLRTAQLTLGCVPTSTVYGHCFAIEREIMARKCLATCDVAACHAGKVTCEQ